MTSIRVWRVVVIAGLMSCNHDGGSGPVAVTAITQRAHDAYCRYYVRCGMYPDLQLCERATFGALQPFYGGGPSVLAAVQAGELEYDATAMTACIDAIANQTCDRTDENGGALPQACLVTAFHGLVPSGGACTYLPNAQPSSNEIGFVTQCVSQQCNYTCDPGVVDPCCHGTCVGDTPPSTDPVPVGQQCGTPTSPPCVDGAFCDTTSVPAVCRDRVAEGNPCTGFCASGLACVGTPLTCKALPTLGEPCPDQECRDDGTYCNSAGICARVGLPGDPCMSFQDCGYPWTCDAATNKCKSPPVTGEPCGSAMAGCLDASYCAPATMTCTALDVNGTACGSDRDCLSGYCDANTSVCIAPPVCI